jgi:hypothetical protein
MAVHEVPDKPRRRPTMQVNCRVPAHVHQQMIQIGELLNIDLTSVLNLLIVEGLPKVLEDARQKADEIIKAGGGLYDTLVNLERDPVVKRLVDEGRKHSDEKVRRRRVVATVLIEDGNNPKAEEKARRAMEILRQEDEKRRVHEEFMELARAGAKKGGKP